MSAKVTLKSTKQEILDALHAAEKKLEEQQKIMSMPTAAAEKTEAEEVVKAAAADVESGIFSDEMNEKYRNLARAIQLQEEKLKASYDVEAGLIDMAVVINAKKQAQMDLEAKLEQARADASAVADALAVDNQLLRDDLAKTRKREQEEYDYNLARKRRQEADEHADKMALLAKQVAEAEARLAELQSDTAAIEALQRRVDDLPDELEARYLDGFNDGKKEAGKEYGYKTTMTEKEHAFEIRERDGRIERLEREVAEKTDKIAALEAKLDSAYTQLRDLATKTVESSGGLKVISTAGDGSSPRK